MPEVISKPGLALGAKEKGSFGPLKSIKYSFLRGPFRLKGVQLLSNFSDEITRGSSLQASTVPWPCQCRTSTLFNKSWDKSLMIGYNLERFANSPANLEHVTLYFDIWWTKMGLCQWFFMGWFDSIVNGCASKWTRDGKLKLKLVRPEKK